MTSSLLKWLGIYIRDALTKATFVAPAITVPRAAQDQEWRLPAEPELRGIVTWKGWDNVCGMALDDNKKYDDNSITYVICALPYPALYFTPFRIQE